MRLSVASLRPMVKRPLPVEFVHRELTSSGLAYYYLGYVCAYAGDAAEGVKMFEKVLAMRANFPEIQEQLR